MPLTYTGIFLGTGPLIDLIEGDNVADNAASLNGLTFGGVQNALVNNIVTITSQNIGGSATALDQNNNVANDQFVVNDGSGPVTYVFDAVAAFNITITYIDGTTANVVGVIFQSTTGELYLAPGIAAGGAYNTALTAAPIRSVTVGTPTTTSAAGLAIDRAALNFPTCFVQGTRIETAGGRRPVERLRPGDLVETADHGPRPLRWIGRRHYTQAEVAAQPELAPVRIAAGALGPGLPQRDLRLSRQHRLVVSSQIARRMAGAGEVLVAVHHLCGLPGIAPDPGQGGVTYWHLMFDAHEIVLAEGARAESFLPGPMALAALEPGARAEVRAILREGTGSLALARPVLTGNRARRLTDRHARNLRNPIAA
ncbi:MAG TPA: Hint domain-containing protein [Paracoccaceae bacterium]|nr:Hint domain-containing protein [Paracoccaceae bacterium]